MTEKPDPAALLPDKGPFEWCGNDGDFIVSRDFTYDAGLKLSGDFPSPEVKRAYMERVMSTLNAALRPHPSADDAAVLDRFEDAVTGVVTDSYGPSYEATRAAVLARMAGVSRMAKLDREELLDALRDIARMPEGDEDSAQKIARATLARFSAAPTEVK